MKTTTEKKINEDKLPILMEANNSHLVVVMEEQKPDGSFKGWIVRPDKDNKPFGYCTSTWRIESFHIFTGKVILEND